MGVKVTRLVVALVVVVVGKTHAQLFESATVLEGAKATLTCDVKKTAPGTPVAVVEALHVDKKAASDAVFVPMAHYIEKTVDAGINFKQRKSDLVSTERIKVSMSGAREDGTNVISNADTMRIKMIFNKVLCEDGAIYRCTSVYKKLSSRRSVSNYTDSILKVVGRVQIAWHVSPERKVYQEDNTVTFTCTAFGPDNVAVRWRYQACPTTTIKDTPMQDWSPTGDIIHKKHGTIQYDGCAYASFKSMLKNAKLSNGARKVCLVQCVAGIVEPHGGEFVEHKQWNRTITYANTAKPASSHLFGFMNVNLYITLGAIGILMTVGLIFGIYDRFKDHNLQMMTTSRTSSPTPAKIWTQNLLTLVSLRQLVTPPFRSRSRETSRLITWGRSQCLSLITVSDISVDTN